MNDFADDRNEIAPQKNGDNQKEKPEIPLNEIDLPSTAKNLVRLIGWRSAIALIKSMPGARIYPPVTPFTDRAEARYAYVAEHIGESKTQRIYDEYRGTVLEIPNCRKAFMLARNRMIKYAYDKGESIEGLCLRFGLSRRQIFVVLKTPDD